MSHFVRYLFVGGIAFLLHLAVLEGLLYGRLASAVTASAIGFVAACVLNFSLQRLVVFRSRRGWAETAWRYIAVTTLMLGVNTVLFLLLHDQAGLDPAVAQTITTGSVFILNFFANRGFTFAAGASS